jgi:aryl-phospho-beta-D-glucosidase BglC (GH1 family)
MAENLLPRLKTAGNRIVDAATLAPVRLRGVNRSGLEYSEPSAPGSLARAGITEADIDEMVTSWGAGIIRLPFNQDWALARAGYDPEPYLSALDFVIENAAKRGVYTLLDLQWLDAKQPHGKNSDGSPNFVPALPNENSPELWRQLAGRYRDQTAVLFDILNEPHDHLPGDPDGTGPVRAAEWHPWAVRLIEAVRGGNPDALIFVGGLNWAYDLSSYPISGVDGVVYSTHVYTNKGDDWDDAFGDLASEQPVFVGEWGGGDGDLPWGQKLLDYMDERELGWTAWSWTDYPRLLTPGGGYQPTVFGQLVKGALSPGA